MNDGLIIGKRKGLNNWLRQFTIYVDSVKNLYKIEESLLGIFRWGTFQKLPALNYVLLFRNFYAKCEQCSLDEENDFSYYQVSLVHHANRRIIVHESKKYEEARKMAEQLSSKLNLRIKDRFSRIEPNK